MSAFSSGAWPRSEDDNKTLLKLWVRVDVEGDRLRVGSYFGYSGQEKWALEHENRSEGTLSQWQFRRAERDSVATEWTENALSMRNDGHRDQCFIRARVLADPDPEPVPAQRSGAGAASRAVSSG